MSIIRFHEKLNVLLSKETIIKDDFLVFLKTLFALSKIIEDVTKLSAYGPVVKDFIGAFRIIFGEHKINQDVKEYINQLCTAVTGVYLELLQKLLQYDRDYTQQFYTHWRQIVSVMNASKRASSFIRNMDQFKHVVTHLRIAKLRCEQLTILKVLNLYIEQVPQSELNNFKAHITDENKLDIIDGLIELRQQPPSIHVHAFLHHINSQGNCIASFEPTKIICKRLALEYSKPEFEMWIDFNLKDNSIMVIAQSVSYANQYMAIVANPQLKECLINGELLIIAKGFWKMKQESSQLGRRFNIKIFFPIHVREKILEKATSVFKIASKTISTCDESSSKDNQSKQTHDECNNVFLIPSTPFHDGRISEATSGQSKVAGSIEASILFLSSDHSVSDWKKNICETFSSDGYQNESIDFNDLGRDKAKNQHIKETAMEDQVVEENAKSSITVQKGNEIIKVIPSLQLLADEYYSSGTASCDDECVPEVNADNKLENLFDASKNEHIKDAATGEEIEDESRTEDVMKYPLVQSLVLDDDQSSGVSFASFTSVRDGNTDDDIDNVYNENAFGRDQFVSDNVCDIPQDPVIQTIGYSFDNLPVEEANTGHIASDTSQTNYDLGYSVEDLNKTKEDNQQMLTCTPQNGINDARNVLPSDLLKNHDESEAFAIDQIDAINASPPREIHLSHNASAQELQNAVSETATNTLEYEFSDEEQLQTAARFYINNMGLHYLKSADFQKLNSKEQKIKEQQLKAIHNMMNRGLEALHPNKDDCNSSADPYAFPSPDQSASKRKSRSKNVARKSVKTVAKKVVFEFPTRKRGKSTETKKVSVTRKRIRNISLLDTDVDEIVLPLKKPKNAIH